MTGDRRRRAVVAGASGVVGSGAVRHLARTPGWDVVGLSRRPPSDLDGATLRAVDLTDAAACRAMAEEYPETTHLVYAAVAEAPGLVAGWQDPDLMATNLQMFANLLDALSERCRTLEHVALLQGTKAYGAHLDRVPIPAREDRPRHPHANFYFLQEDHLRARAVDAEWSWTILRPQVVVGESIGSNMNVVPALGAYAEVMRAMDEPLHFPGGAPSVTELVSADLLARAVEWAGSTPAARNEIFNVTNGDVLVWRDAWPTIAAAFGMEPGDDRPMSLAEEMPRHASRWAALVERHALRAPADLDAFVGQGFAYADMLLGLGRATVGLPALVSTIKIRRAGFGECVDSEADLVAWFDRLRARKLLPSR